MWKCGILTTPLLSCTYPPPKRNPTQRTLNKETIIHANLALLKPPWTLLGLFLRSRLNSIILQGFAPNGHKNATHLFFCSVREEYRCAIICFPQLYLILSLLPKAKAKQGCFSECNMYVSLTYIKYSTIIIRTGLINSLCFRESFLSDNKYFGKKFHTQRLCNSDPPDPFPCFPSTCSLFSGFWQLRYRRWCASFRHLTFPYIYLSFLTSLIQTLMPPS